jgi:hypothetical protein
VDGWVDGSVGGWVDGWVDGWMVSGWKDWWENGVKEQIPQEENVFPGIGSTQAQVVQRLRDLDGRLVKQSVKCFPTREPLILLHSCRAMPQHRHAMGLLYFKSL